MVKNIGHYVAWPSVVVSPASLAWNKRCECRKMSVSVWVCAYVCIGELYAIRYCQYLHLSILPPFPHMIALAISIVSALWQTLKITQWGSMLMWTYCPAFSRTSRKRPRPEPDMECLVPLAWETVQRIRQVVGFKDTTIEEAIIYLLDRYDALTKVKHNVVFTVRTLCSCFCSCYHQCNFSYFGFSELSKHS